MAENVQNIVALYKSKGSGQVFLKRSFLKHFLNKLAQENRPKPFTIFLLENKFIKTQSLKDL